MIEQTILSNLLYNDAYARKVIVFLKSEYFNNNTEKIVFDEIQTFYSKYNDTPSKEALKIAIEERTDLSSGSYQELETLIGNISNESTDTNDEWLHNETEKFCKDKAVYNAIMDSINIIDNPDSNNGGITDLLSDALAVSFDTHIGHDFLEDYENRFEFYHRKEERIPFDLDYFNKITKGGIPNKTLNIFMAGTGVGKTLAMCHVAASNLSIGKNVLYITMEMAEERIAERIDANLLNTDLDDIESLSYALYEKKLKQIKKKTTGKLIVKEFPTAGAHVGHFRHLLKELQLKKKFTPDVIFIDYLNICASQRLASGNSVNSYTYVKAIAEELRGLAVEYNVPIWSATQVNRGGFSSSDMGLEDTSESFGLPATADLFLALIQTEELVELNRVMIKQLKNRYGDININKRFVLGIDKPKMKLYDVEQDAQVGLTDSGGTAGDQSEFSSKMEEKRAKFSKFQM